MYNLNINCEYVFQFDENLYVLIIQYPEELLALIQLEVQAIFAEMFPDSIHLFPTISWGMNALINTYNNNIQVRVFNLRSTKPMRDLNPTGTYGTPLMILQALTRRRYWQNGFYSWHDNSYITDYPWNEAWYIWKEGKNKEEEEKRKN